jgi:hypothetical protein
MSSGARITGTRGQGPCYGGRATSDVIGRRTASRGAIRGSPEAADGAQVRGGRCRVLVVPPPPARYDANRESPVSMRPVPTTIRGLRVLAYTSIDGRHRFTGANERRSVDVTGAENLLGPVAGLAICRETEGEGVVLFGCDRDWRPDWETACVTVAVAQSQAEFEYEGVSRTWLQAAR